MSHAAGAARTLSGRNVTALHGQRSDVCINPASGQDHQRSRRGEQAVVDELLDNRGGFGLSVIAGDGNLNS